MSQGKPDKRLLDPDSGIAESVREVLSSAQNDVTQDDVQRLSARLAPLVGASIGAAATASAASSTVDAVTTGASLAGETAVTTAATTSNVTVGATTVSTGVSTKAIGVAIATLMIGGSAVVVGVRTGSNEPHSRQSHTARPVEAASQPVQHGPTELDAVESPATTPMHAIETKPTVPTVTKVDRTTQTRSKAKPPRQTRGVFRSKSRSTSSASTSHGSRTPLASESKSSSQTDSQPQEPQPQQLTTLGAETQLLRSARQLLEDAPASALRLLNQHAREYPNGLLAEERKVLKTQAYKALGREGNVTKLKERLTQEHPNSIYSR